MRKIIISFFERGIFLYQDNVFKTKEEESEEERKKNSSSILTMNQRV